MTITSFYYLLFVAVGFAIYYMLPKSFQWVQLLVMSLLFYSFAADPYTIIYPLISTLTAWGAVLWTDRLRSQGFQNTKPLLIVTIVAIAVNTLIWFVFKGYGLWSTAANIVFRTSIHMELIGALGMGYYTLQIIGYILDCYWQTIQPQKNPFKLFLFTIFFPQMITGPISRYAQLETLYERHKFDHMNLCHGSQRILWGFFKKLVLSERVAILVSGIYADMNTYDGFYLWVMILLYPIQMYADFSGCIDIVLGTAELFDIRLPENFKNPFFSRTAQEFWQRWHITLGGWAKDYVLYPLLKTRTMVKLGRMCKKRFGKRWGKFIPTAVGMFILWMVMGIWHGMPRYIIGVSLWYWIILMLGELFSEPTKKLIVLLEIRTESFSWHLFQSVRTYLIYAVGAVFFCYGAVCGLPILRAALEVFRGMDEGTANPWIFFNGSVLNLGITHEDINIIIFSVLLLVIVAVLREKYGYARTWMDQQGFLFRWATWILLFLLVLIYGKYGPGYNPAEFIYQGF